MKKILFIGRFQPFHLGHLTILKEINDRNDVQEIIIGVGSSQYSGTTSNPFSFEQRKIMIEKSLENEVSKKFKVVAIPDVHNNNIWVDHVIKITGQVDQVCTGNRLVKKLFKQKRIKIKLVFKLVFKYRFLSATKIRKLIKNNDSNWEKLVPQAEIEFLKKYAGNN